VPVVSAVEPNLLVVIARRPAVSAVGRIACGHLREAMISRAILERRISEFIALDQDQESLDHIAETYTQHNIRIVNGSVRAVISGAVKLGGFNLIYAAGLYDYLVDRVAARLTAATFDMLVSGGRLLVANFAPTGRDIAYMEKFMRWKLIYRTEDDIMRLAGGIVPESIRLQDFSAMHTRMSSA